MIVTERGNEQTILPLPPDANEALVANCWRRRSGGSGISCLRRAITSLWPDYPADEAAQAAWRAYRQALRDMPEQPGFPMEVEWPEVPDEAEEVLSDDAGKDESDDHSGEDPD